VLLSSANLVVPWKEGQVKRTWYQFTFFSHTPFFLPCSPSVLNPSTHSVKARQKEKTLSDKFQYQPYTPYLSTFSFHSILEVPIYNTEQNSLLTVLPVSFKTKAGATKWPWQGACIAISAFQSYHPSRGSEEESRSFWFGSDYYWLYDMMPYRTTVLRWQSFETDEESRRRPNLPQNLFSLLFKPGGVRRDSCSSIKQ
jgi:hypothetical protein